MEIAAFIFDVDGVLTDTVEPHYRSWQRLAAEEGIVIRPEFKDRDAGTYAPRVAGDVSRTAGCPRGSMAQEYLRARTTYFLESLAELTEADLLPGRAGRSWKN